MNKPQDVLQEHLNGITQVKKTAKGNDLVEIKRYETIFRVAIRWIDLMISFRYMRNGIPLSNETIKNRIYQQEYRKKTND